MGIGSELNYDHDETMDQVNLSFANRRTRKGRSSSNNAVETLNTPSSPHSPILTVPSMMQSMDTKAEQESRRTRIGSFLNPLPARFYVLFRSVPWISRQASYLQICVTLYVLFSLIAFNPLVFYRWIFSGDSLNVGYYSWSLPWSSSPRADIYGTMTTSLLFSKLSPHLGNLAPDAVQIVFDSLKHGGNVGRTESEIASCVWIPDTHIRALESWTGLDGHPISALVTTSHSSDSPAFQKLTKDITRIVHRNIRLKGTVLLISTQTWLSNTNAYINLARLFARADWVLLIPPMLEPLLPSNDFAQTVSRLDHRIQTLDSNLLFRLSNNGNRIMGGILIPQSSPVWCSERYYVSNVGHEWSDCIQETLSYYRELDASNSTDSNENVE